MRYEDKKIPRIIGNREDLPEGANFPTSVTVHECFCGVGTVEFHRVAGFDDEWFEICCPECEKKYSSVIDRIGDEWRVYLED